MFEIKHIHGLLKPFTNYDIIIGGTDYKADFVKGVAIASLINSQILTSQSKEWQPIENSELANVRESSLIQWNLQLDFYKRNDENVDTIQAFNEAIKVRECLKGLDCYDFLKALDSEILPNYSIIQFTTEAVDNKIINRAFFEFSIISRFEIFESDSKLENVTISNEILSQGE